MKKSIVLTGNYFVGNVGDNLLFESAIVGLRKELADHQLSLMLPFGSESQPGAYWLFPTGFRSLFKCLKGGRLFKTIKLLKRSDILVFGGGGLLNCEVRKSLWIWGVQIVVARLLKIKIVMLGQSFPKANLTKNRRWFKWLLNMCSLVTVRDHCSYKVAVELAKDSVIIKETADLALIKDYKLSNSNNNELLINLRSYNELEKEDLLIFAVKLVKFFFDNSDYDLVLVGMDTDDYELFSDLLEILPKHSRVSIFSYQNDENLITKFEQVSGVISMRLHGCILAALQNKPLFCLAYNDKNVGFIDQLEFNTVPMLDLRNELGLDEPEMVSRLQEFLNNVASGIDLATQLKKLRAKSQLNFTYLSGWLED